LVGNAVNIETVAGTSPAAETQVGDVLRERNILRIWVQRAEDEPDQVEDHDDGTRHFIKQISENDGGGCALL